MYELNQNLRKDLKKQKDEWEDELVEAAGATPGEAFLVMPKAGSSDDPLGLYTGKRLHNTQYNPKASSKLFVGFNITRELISTELHDYTTSQAVLRDTFNNFGDILKIDMKGMPYYAIIHFAEINSVVTAMNGTPVGARIGGYILNLGFGSL